MHALAGFLVLDALKTIQHLMVLRGRDHLVGHGEQDAVLFGNVLAQQRRLTARIANQLAARRLVAGDELFGGLAHAARISAPLLVLGQHHGDWPAFA